MTREDIIRMALEAGVYSGANEMVFAASLERFAALVAAASASVEREACAKVADWYHIPMCDTVTDLIAVNIRARSQQ